MRKNVYTVDLRRLADEKDKRIVKEFITNFNNMPDWKKRKLGNVLFGTIHSGEFIQV